MKKKMNSIRIENKFPSEYEKFIAKKHTIVYNIKKNWNNNCNCFTREVCISITINIIVSVILIVILIACGYAVK